MADEFAELLATAQPVAQPKPDEFSELLNQPIAEPKSVQQPDEFAELLTPIPVKPQQPSTEVTAIRQTQSMGRPSLYPQKAPAPQARPVTPMPSPSGGEPLASPAVPPVAEKQSFLGTMARSAASQAIPTATAALAGQAGMRGGMALGALTGQPIAVGAGALTGAVSGGALGGMAGEKVQSILGESINKAKWDEWQQTLAEGQQQHPYAAKIGSFIPQAALFKFSPKSIWSNLKFASTLRKQLLGKTAKEIAEFIKKPAVNKEVGKLVNMLVGSGFQGAASIVQQIKSGKADVADLLISILGGAAFTTPRKYTPVVMGGTPKPELDVAGIHKTIAPQMEAQAKLERPITKVPLSEASLPPEEVLAIRQGDQDAINRLNEVVRESDAGIPASKRPYTPVVRIAGEPVEGKPGQSHNDVRIENGLDPVEPKTARETKDYEFATPEGEIISREEGAKREGQKEPLHTSDLDRAKSLAKPSTDPEMRKAMEARLVERGAPEVASQADARAKASELVVNRGGALNVLKDMAAGNVETGDVGSMVSKEVFGSPEVTAKLAKGDTGDIIAAYDAHVDRGTDVAREFAARHDEVKTPQGRRAYAVTELIETEVKAAKKSKPPTESKITEKISSTLDKLESDSRKALNEIRRQGRLGAGPDPEVMYHYSVIGAAKLARKGMAFGKWANEMVKDFGESIRPQLNKLWAMSKSVLAENRTTAIKAIKVAEIDEVVRQKYQQLQKAGYDIATMTDEDIMNPDKFAGIIKELSIMNAGKGDMVLEYWRNSILSGLKTHEVNFLGNTANWAYEGYINKWIEAGLGAITKSEHAPTAESIRAMYKALAPAKAEATQKFFDAFRREVVPDMERVIDVKYGVAIPGKAGEVIRVPQRLLLASDEYSKTMITKSAAADYAVREANAKGLSGADKDAYVYESVNNPDSTASSKALDEARRLTFQEDTGAITGALIKFRNSDTSMITKFLFPFVKTPANIVKQGLRKSPLGAIGMGIKAIKGQYRDDAGRQKMYRDMAEQVFGIIVTGALMAANKYNKDKDGQPAVTGSRPSTADKGKSEFMSRNIPAQSIRIGNTYYSYGRIEPIATALSTMVDIQDALFKSKDGETWDRLLASLKSNIKDKTFLQTFSDLVEIASSSKGVAATASKIAQTFASGFVPNLIKSPLRDWDDYQRDYRVREPDKALMAEWAKATGQKAIPYEGIAPIARYDIWGNPVQKQGPFESNSTANLLYRLIVPIQTQKANNMNNIDRLIWNWNRTVPTSKDEYWVDPVALTFQYHGKNYPLNERQFQQLQQMRGQIAQDMLKNITGLNFDNPKQRDIDKVKDIFEKANKQVRVKMAQTEFKLQIEKDQKSKVDKKRGLTK